MFIIENAHPIKSGEHFKFKRDYLAVYLSAPEVENDRRSLNVIYGMRRAMKEGRWMNKTPASYCNKVTEDGK